MQHTTESARLRQVKSRRKPQSPVDDPFFAFMRFDPDGLDRGLAIMLRDWQRKITSLAHAGYELIAEDVAPIVVTFNQLRSAGVQFDPALNVLMHLLERQMFNGPDDADFDTSLLPSFEDEWQMLDLYDDAKG